MAAAMEAAGTTDSADVVAALQALDFQNAVTGSISFDSNGDPIKAVTIIKVVDGEHVVETKVDAS
jgi:branched-chain amino acid transport system substrate-binding protein